MRLKHVPHLDTAQDGLSPSTSHPDYVAAAPEWFWSEGDPRAPFGTDDGHDTLTALQGHFIQGGGDEHVPGCIANLISGWALVPERDRCDVLEMLTQLEPGRVTAGVWERRGRSTLILQF